MHIDENKKFDKRNVKKNIKNGIITQKDYEIYLSKLPDIIDKIFTPEESLADSKEFKSTIEDEIKAKKKGAKKKTTKWKGK